MKRNIFVSFFLFSVVYVFAAQPQWLSDLESVYPDAKYLAAVCSGKTEKEAKENAMAEITSYFGSSVSSKVTANTSAVQFNINGSETTQKTKSVNENITIEYADTKLYGLEYAESYYDKKSKCYFSLAFINRQKVTNQLLPKIENLKLDFENFYDMAQAEINTEPFSAFKNLNLASSKGKELESYIEYLRVINLAQTKNYQTVSKKIINCKKQIENCKNNCVFFINFDGDEENIITNVIKSSFGKYKFIFCDNIEAANYLIVVTAKDNEQIEENFGTVVYTENPTIYFSLLNKNTSSVVYSETSAVKQKQSAISRNAARKKCYTEIATNLKLKIEKYLQK